MSKKYSELAGWYGVVAVLSWYMIDTIFLKSKTPSPMYYLAFFLNISGCIGIIIDASSDKNPQPIVINVIWIGIALLGLFFVK